MKKFYTFITVFFLCSLFVACSTARQRAPFTPSITDRMNAVMDILETERSKIDLPPEETTAVTKPQYFEVVATGTTAATTEAKPVVTEAPKEYFTVKFVDTDGYTSISVQTVIESGSAVAPDMPASRGDLLFRGWDKEFSDIHRGTIVKAIYQKEFLTVRFFDANAALLKTEQVRYGESATSPEVSDKPGYLFDGWNTSVDKITEDIDVYATYSAIPVRHSVPLPQLYTLCEVAENTEKLPAAAYYRKLYENVVTIGQTEYAGNILYGCFSDTLTIGELGLTSFEGTLVFEGIEKEDSAKNMALRLYIYVDGVQKFKAELKKAHTSKKFSVDVTDAKTLTVKLEPLVDNFIYYEDAEFIGGLVDAALYKD